MHLHVERDGIMFVEEPHTSHSRIHASFMNLNRIATVAFASKAHFDFMLQEGPDICTLVHQQRFEDMIGVKLEYLNLSQDIVSKMRRRISPNFSRPMYIGIVVIGYR